MLRDVKRKCIVKEFAALHNNSPEIPMVSWLDINGIPDGNFTVLCTNVFVKGWMWHTVNGSLTCPLQLITEELYQRMPIGEEDMPLQEDIPIKLALSPDSKHGDCDIGEPALSSTPKKPDLSPGGQTSSSGVSRASPCGQVTSCGVHTSSRNQIFSSSVPRASSGVQTSSSGGLGHSNPLPSSPVSNQQESEAMFEGSQVLLQLWKTVNQIGCAWKP